MNEIQKALEKECTPFANPMGATSLMIDKKVDQVKELLKKWEDADKAADLAETKKQEELAEQNHENKPKKSKSKLQKDKLKRLQNAVTDPSSFIPRSPIEVLSMAGIKSSDLNKIKKIMSEAKKISDIGRNYGKESNVDFVKKVAGVQTFIKHKGLSSSASCDVLNSVFNVSMGLGKALLGSIGGNVGEISGMLSKIGGWLDQGLVYGQDIANKIMQTYSDITGLLDNTLLAIQNVANQLKQAIQAELDALKEILLYNSRMALGSLLGGLLDDPCVSGLVSNIGNSTLKRFF